MPANPYQLLVECTRGPLVESIHFGALTVVDTAGNLVASVGDPDLYANLRSSSKPFQALPLIENGGVETFGLVDREISIMCASHSGTDDHVEVLKHLQARLDVQVSDLLCGVHPAMYKPTETAMLLRGEQPDALRHNCSGKHTGMLAQARLNDLPLSDYLNREHPVQRVILQTFAEMCDLTPQQVLIGIDGCSAPTFAVPLRSAALAYARLADPDGLPAGRAAALRRIVRAMTSQPDMVAGPNRFDTLLMQVTAGKIVSKGGAEGYQAIGLLPGALGPGSPALGITYKIADGDLSDRARAVVGITILRQIGALNEQEVQQLRGFDARPIYNWRKIEVGEIRPVFTLEPVFAR
jgi:L-asparaginase II